MTRLLLLLLAAILTSCAVVKVEDYVHAETAAILNTFYWTADKRSLGDVMAEDNRDLVLVPDFRSFTPGKSGSAKLRIVAKEQQNIQIERLVIWSAATGKSTLQATDKKSELRQSSNGWWLDTLSILDGRDNAGLANASKLRLSVSWRVVGSSQQQVTDFVLQYRIKRDVAWRT